MNSAGYILYGRQKMERETMKSSDAKDVLRLVQRILIFREVTGLLMGVAR